MKEVTLVVLFLIANIVSGCNTGYNNLKLIYTNDIPDIMPKKGSAKLVIFNSNSPEPIDGYAVYLSRKYAGQLYNNTYFAIDVNPGERFLTVAHRYHVVASNHLFEEGKVYFFGLDSTVTFTYGLLNRRPLGFYPIDKLTAKQLMAKYKYYYLKSGSVDIIDYSAFEVEENNFYRDIKENPDDYKKILNYKGAYVFNKFESNIYEEPKEKILAFYDEQENNKALSSGKSSRGVDVIGISYSQSDVISAKKLSLEKCETLGGVNCKIIDLNGLSINESSSQ